LLLSEQASSVKLRRLVLYFIHIKVAMFGKTKPIQVITPPPRVQQPKPIISDEKLDIEFAELCQEEYSKVANAIGFNSAAIWERRILTLLHSLGHGIYNYEEVKEYLDQEFGKEKFEFWGQTWGWRSLRLCDNDNSGLVDFGHRGNSLNGNFELEGPYGEAVPLQVLEIIQKILEVDSNTNFFVSDIIRTKDKKPLLGDPFLAISYTEYRGKLLVICCWDEPGFTGKAK